MNSVSVIIPALNEEEPIGGVVRECLAAKIPREVIVVDNGSDDRTGERARAAGAKVILEPPSRSFLAFAGMRCRCFPRR